MKTIDSYTKYSTFISKTKKTCLPAQEDVGGKKRTKCETQNCLHVRLRLHKSKLGMFSVSPCQTMTDYVWILRILAGVSQDAITYVAYRQPIELLLLFCFMYLYLIGSVLAICHLYDRGECHACLFTLFGAPSTTSHSDNNISSIFHPFGKSSLIANAR